MRFAKKPNFPSMLFVAICLLTAHPAFSQTPYYAGKTITMIRGRRLGRISIQSADAVSEKIYTRQPS